MKAKILIIILFTTFVACTEDKVEVDPFTPLENLFFKGCKLQLEQVYVMSNPQLIPIVDKPIDNCFKTNSMINIDQFFDYDTNAKVFPVISKDEVWTVSPMQIQYDTTYSQRGGYGEEYSVRVNIDKITYNIISRDNGYQNGKLIFPITIGGYYNRYGNDNYNFEVLTVDDTNNEVRNSNLRLEVLTDFKGNGVIEDYVYFDSNELMGLSYNLTTPLTGNEVEQEIANGNYSLYVYQGMTTFKIGNNLYIPRYNSYVYLSCVNTNGMIIYADIHYYRFKFKILK